MSMSESIKYNILTFSNQLWDFPNWTNKRHVMFRLSKLGHKIIFVDPPINAGFVLLRNVLKGYWSIFRLITQVKKDGNIVIFTPVNFTPFFKFNAFLHSLQLKLLAFIYFKGENISLTWVYHVQLRNLFTYLKAVKTDKLIYDCVDNYEAFPDNQIPLRAIVRKSELPTQERSLATKADIVFATAPGLMEKLKKFNQNIYFTPNVGDYELFRDTKKLKDQLPEDLKAIPRPRIVYIGAMDDYKFDYELLKHSARALPNCSFVLIGPMALKDREAKDSIFEGYSNIYFMGSRPYNQKPYYEAGSDVDIIPYVLNDYTVVGCFPVKFHDSLSAGIPVVVTDLPSYYPFRDVSYISKTYDDFVNNIKRALDEDSPDKIKARQDVAKENTWDKKVEQMLGIISTDPKSR